jgi:hypothetical protein
MPTLETHNDKYSYDVITISLDNIIDFYKKEALNNDRFSITEKWRTVAIDPVKSKVVFERFYEKVGKTGS